MNTLENYDTYWKSEKPITEGQAGGGVGVVGRDV